MKDFPGIPFAALPDIKSPDFVSRLRNMLGTIDAWGRDASAGFARLSVGQVPTGSGQTVFGSGATSSGGGSSGSSTIQGGSPGGNIMEWRDFGGSLVAYMDFAGDFHGPAFEAETPIGAAFNAVMSATGQVTCRDLVIIVGGTVMASIDTGGYATFDNGMQSCTGAVLLDTAGILDSIPLKDAGTGNVGTLGWSGIAAGAALTLPSVSGTILSSNNAVNVSSKTLLNDTIVRCNTANGTTFVDNLSTTKQMRFDCSGITAGTTRAQKWQDTAGSVVTVGNTTSASGVLGTIALTAQTGSLGAQTLLTGNASSAGLYRVSFYLKCSTAGTAGSNVTATLAWNEGTAQTMVVAFLGGGGTNSNTVPYVGHDLGTANTFSEASVVVKASASQNITFTTTITVIGGSPAYNIDARIEALG